MQRAFIVDIVRYPPLEAIPPEYRQYLLYNPLVHTIEYHAHVLVS